VINQKIKPGTFSSNELYHPSYSLLNKISNFLAVNLYKQFFWFEHWHHPQPYTKKNIQTVLSLFNNEMKVASKNRFRTSTDLTAYIYRYWHLLTGDYYPFKYNDGAHVQLSSKDKIDKLKQELAAKNINFICFNDTVHLSDDEFISVRLGVNEMLSEHFKLKASFEK
jgi:hypothetical protein